MSRTKGHRILLALVPGLLLLHAPAVPAGDRYPHEHPRGSPSQPSFHVTLRTGEFEPDGDSDLWRENVDLYGLTPDGVSDWTFGVEFGTAINDHVEVLFGLDYFEGEDASSRFVDTNGVPIVLANELEILPVTASLKFMPIGRYGRGEGFRRLLPYVGGGAGIYFWDYEEAGDFIDPFSGVVTSGRAEADGSAFGTHLFLGIEVAMTPDWSLTLEGRRSFVDDDLGGQFEGFEDFDLSGDSLLVGASFRF